ncbi:MAG: hypothetical protein FRX48_05558 [Lasallia pustulata]|uniref:Uncharacterized protein n=1 Tax=Lasallia pustulata TaxID=136370 RepID=A0A5M8PMD0_9LECA|nr:MAG: hypothetical protein FRX48_05558 [Lasallia pustulata]
MGWFGGSGKNGSSKDNNGDPLQDLDPSLREFLEKESPVKYQTSKPPPPPPSAQDLSPQLDKSDSIEASTSSSSTTTPTVPAPSLFPDGRYAHLWSTYRPQGEIENEGKSDQEKLQDVISGYKDRKAQIGRAALENCANEHWILSDCFRNGGWSSRLTMCRTDNQKLGRCYMMQARFLKALGYISTYDRPPEVDERIQMYADTLYHRMLEQERAIKEAKAAGKPIPEFPPFVTTLPAEPSTPSPQAPASSDAAAISPTQPEELPTLTPDQFSPRVQARLAQRLKGLSPAEREVEEKAIAMEIRAAQILGRQIEQLFDEQGKEKKERKRRGEVTFADKVSTLFGW